MSDQTATSWLSETRSKLHEQSDAIAEALNDLAVTLGDQSDRGPTTWVDLRHGVTVYVLTPGLLHRFSGNAATRTRRSATPGNPSKGRPPRESRLATTRHSQSRRAPTSHWPSRRKRGRTTPVPSSANGHFASATIPEPSRSASRPTPRRRSATKRSPSLELSPARLPRRRPTPVVRAARPVTPDGESQRSPCRSAHAAPATPGV
jgi:hypothetical protein